ncbi:MAG: hypothetical protein RL095_2328 [Verrucomicrobiota bacterium]|jgi:VCBS repeat-containing protein
MLDRNQDRPSFENLEERILMSVAPVDDQVAVIAAVESQPAEAAVSTSELVFIDSAVADAASLLANIPANAEVFTLEAGTDGVAQISAILASRSNVSAIHIISHGSEGSLNLGSSTLESSNVAATSAWKAALTANADILVYGCDVAAGTQGAAFVAALAASTGADVAASDDSTSAADDTLEVSTGAIQTATIRLAGFSGELAVADTTIVVQDNEDDFNGYNFTPADFGMASGNTLTIITNTTNASTGRLLLFGNVLSGPVTLDYADVLGALTFDVVGAVNANAVADYSFTYSVNGGATKNAAVDIHTAPTVTADTTYTADNAGYVALTLNDFGTYADAIDLNALNRIRITGVASGNITLAYGASNIAVASGEFTLTQISGGKLKYNAASGATTTVVNFQVADSEGRWSTQQTLTINVIDLVGAVRESGNFDNGTVDAGTNTDTGAVGAGWSTSTTGTYGTGSIVGNNWNYALNNGNSTVNALAEGQSITDSFVIVNGSNSATVTVVITGTNDSPTASNVTGPTYTDTAGDDTFASTSGTFTASDVDTGATSTFTGTSTGTYGTLTVNTNGTYTFVPNDAAIEALTANTTEVFNVLVTDDKGASTAFTYTINLVGANDTPVTSGSYSGSVVEAGILFPTAGTVSAGTPTATGDANYSDRDTAQPQDAWTSVTAGAATIGAYGTYGVTAAGVWTYTLDNANATVQALDIGATLTDTFTISPTNGGISAQTVTITITGQNDAPTGTNVSTTIADTAANDTFTNPTGTFVGSDVDDTSSELSYTTNTTVGTYGTLTLSSNGTYTYSVNDAAVEALTANASDVFTITVTDDNGATGSFTYTVNFTGADDTPVTSGSFSGTVVEAGILNPTAGTVSAGTSTVSGDANYSDRDTAQAQDVWTAAGPAAATTNGYGTFAVTTSGVWTFTLDNANAAVQALDLGATLVDTFTISPTNGGIGGQTVTITINGQNDAPTGTNSTGTITDTAADDTFANLTGTFTANDVDDTAGELTYATNTTVGTYGTFSVLSGGGYTYTPNDAAIEALTANASDTFTITVTDDNGATGTFTYTVNITGANDTPVFTGSYSGTVIESGYVSAGTSTVSGDANYSDRDTAQAQDVWTAAGPSAVTIGGYGSYAVTTSGVWTYTLSNGNAAVDGLDDTETLTDTFTITPTNGSAQTVTVTINGQNDAPVGTSATGTVNDTAATGGTLTDLTGNFVATDVDVEPLTFTGTSTQTYGTLTVNTDGSYTYNPNEAAVDALGAGQSATETFTISVSDGTVTSTFTYTVTINGTNDTPVVSTDGSTGAVTEAGYGVAGTATSTGNASYTDADGQNDVWTATSASTTYGSYTVDSAGAWTYTLDNTLNATQALDVGDAPTDTFTLVGTDGATRIVTITVTGTNDGPTGSNVTGPTYTDTSADDTFTTSNGTFTASDVDDTAGQLTYTGTSTGTYGTLTVNADGTYSYVPVDAAIEELKSGTYTDVFTITVTDDNGATGTYTYTVNIVAADDTPDYSGVSTGAVTEAGAANAGTPTSSGDLNFTDRDLADPDDTWTSVTAGAATVGGYGTYGLTAAGVWTYTLDNTNSAVNSLDDTETLTDTFVVTASTGAETTVTITINGQNDAPTASNDVYVVEVGDTLTVSTVSAGILGNDTDVDIETITASITAGISNGTLTMSSNGTFTYNTTGGTPAVGDSTYTFTYVANDGTVNSSPATVSINVVAALVVTHVGDDIVAGPDSLANASLNQQDAFVVNVAGAQAGSTIGFKINGVALAPSAITSLGSGNYQLDLTSIADTPADLTSADIPGGVWANNGDEELSIVAVETNVAGGWTRESKTVNSLTADFDNSAAAPGVTLPAMSAMNAWNYTISGTAEAFATVEITSITSTGGAGPIAPGGILPTYPIVVQANAAGVWTTNVNLANLPDGTLTVVTKQTDYAGNVSSNSSTMITKNTNDISTVGVGDVTPANKSAYRISGYAKPGAQVQVTIATKNSVIVTADAQTGAWSTTINFGTYAATNGTALVVTMKQTPSGGTAIITSNSASPAIAYRTTNATVPTRSVGSTAVSTYTISGTAAGSTVVGSPVTIVLQINNGRTLVLSTTTTTAGGAYSLTVDLSSLASAGNTVTAWVYYRDNSGSALTSGRQGQAASITTTLTTAEESSMIEEFRSMQDSDGLIDWAKATHKPVAGDDLAWADFMQRPSLSDALSIEVDAFRS